MIRILLYLASVFALAAGASWIVDRPGTISFEWLGYYVETSITVALIALAVFVVAVIALWSLLLALVRSPHGVARYFGRRRRERGRVALSRGLVAVGAGDLRLARRYMTEARRILPRDPATRLLEAQTAQLAGDRTAARAAFEGMLRHDDTRLLGLRGLYIEATREGASEAAESYAEKAVQESPSLPWASQALFEQAAAQHDWELAIARLDRNAGARLVEKPQARRLKAVLLTARALELEEGDPERARTMALEAHRLAPDLEPAAAVAGRLLVRQNETRKATKVIEATWRLAPHPELAEIYADIRPGSSARDRLKRLQTLAALTPGHVEADLAVARAAIEAREFDTARTVLRPILESRPTRRACLLMADLEEAAFGAGGRMREWLARAINAARDPAWTADGIVADAWAPVSPVSGELDAFVWKAPAEALSASAPAVVDEALFAAPPPPPPPPVEPLPAVPAAIATPAGTAGIVLPDAQPPGDISLPKAPDDPGPVPTGAEFDDGEVIPPHRRTLT